MRIAVCGGVNSTRTLIRKLHKIEFMETKVWGFRPSKTSSISGWVDLEQLCRDLNMGYESFVSVGSIYESMKEFKPDVLFVVGLSQIVPKDILDLAQVANIGFHPTSLPRGRGRAPLAWLILEQVNGAATFFVMTEGVDDGPIVSQTPFVVEPEDTPKEVSVKVQSAIEVGLESLLPNLKERVELASKQDESKATWFGRRKPSDGWINWDSTVSQICRLVRASAPPLPCARTVSEDSLIKLLEADDVSRDEKGVIGRVLQVFDDNSFTVQASDGVVRITHWECRDNWKPVVGSLLGYKLEHEIFKLRAYCRELEKKIASMEAARSLVEKGKS